MDTDISGISLLRMDGSETSLGVFKGKVLLIVNVASKCGLTPQYQGLEELYSRYKGRGLEVLGFPANDFGAQEPGSNAEIMEFCGGTYGVSFPMFGKIAVKGGGQHPLYRALTRVQPLSVKKPDSGFEDKLKAHGLLSSTPGDITWNFEKFIVDRRGKAVRRFAPDVEPLDPLLVGALESCLEEKP